MSITVGADPEFFLYNKRRYRAEPCIGRIAGTKEAVFDLGDGFGAHEDNVTIELTVPPASDPITFAMNIEKGKKLITDRFLTDGERLMCRGSSEFLDSELQHPQAQRFGCDPDYNAYSNGRMRRTPKRVLNSNIRYAGGHVHIGGNFNCPPFVAALFADVVISLPDYLPTKTGQAPSEASNSNKLRRHWYGRPGVFRPKEYGIEYRTPSNYWCNDRGVMEQMGYRAFALGTWLEDNPASTIRKALLGIDWIAVRRVLSDGSTTLFSEKPSIRKQAEIVYAEAMQAMGLAA